MHSMVNVGLSCPARAHRMAAAPAVKATQWYLICAPSPMAAMIVNMVASSLSFNE